MNISSTPTPASSSHRLPAHHTTSPKQSNRSRALDARSRPAVRRFLAGSALATSVIAGTMVGAATAHATDSGGDGSPSGCSNSYTVASRQIVGSRGVTAGKVIGYLELRYSAGCNANWARVVLLGNLYSSPVAVEQEITAEGRTAMANDYNIRTGANGTSAWTRYVRLQNSQSTACVRASVSSDFGTLNYHTNGANFCV